MARFSTTPSSGLAPEAQKSPSRRKAQVTPLPTCALQRLIAGLRR